ncbi:MAG: hypothetical protein HY902_14280 [Deltaproteobacteria bacterium]|nr:hypothetical protein [Deltaproteobacteria bacterium]
MLPVRLSRPGLQLRGFAGARRAELTAVAQPLPGEVPEDVVERMHAALAPYAVTVVKVDVFGALEQPTALRAALSARFGPVPATWVAGEGCGASGLAGVTVLAVAGDPVQPVPMNGRVVGLQSCDGECQWLWLGDLHPDRGPQAPADQAAQVFDKLAAAIDAAAMPAASLTRTWFYFQDLLSWYGDFNAARTRCFGERGWLPLLPASTGIDAANPHGGALVASAVAVAPVTGTATVQAVESPLQGPATAYGSSFSRAVEVQSAGLRRLWISGTASIDPSGATAHLGDLDSQISLTFRVVLALLQARALRWDDVTRAVAYVNRSDHAAPLQAWLERQGLDLPLVICRAGICRADLLFEIELDAAAPIRPPPLA